MEFKLLLVLMVGWVLVSSLGCVEDQYVRKDDETLILQYSTVKIRCIGVGKNGELLFSKYDGVRQSFSGLITRVETKSKSESVIRITEDEQVSFQLDPVFHSGDRIYRVIAVNFDHRDLILPKPFVRGDAWEITLGENLEFVELRPSK